MRLRFLAVGTFVVGLFVLTVGAEPARCSGGDCEFVVEVTEDINCSENATGGGEDGTLPYAMCHGEADWRALNACESMSCADACENNWGYAAGGDCSGNLTSDQGEASQCSVMERVRVGAWPTEINDYYQFIGGNNVVGAVVWGICNCHSVDEYPPMNALAPSVILDPIQSAVNRLLGRQPAAKPAAKPAGAKPKATPKRIGG